MASPKNNNSELRSACARVFEIAELADQILLDLPPQDILCGAQQVCRQWKEAVEESDLIQEHLFMQPICGKRLIFRPNRFRQPVWTDFEYDNLPLTLLENPFLIKMSHEDVFTRNEAFMRPEASWRKMLITQPAAGEAMFNRLRYIVEKDDAGVTLGDLSDELQGKNLACIEAWWTWKAYEGPQQLQEAKVAMRSGRPLVDVNEDEDQEEDDDLWWLPDEYLSGI